MLAPQPEKDEIHVADLIIEATSNFISIRSSFPENRAVNKTCNSFSINCG